MGGMSDTASSKSRAGVASRDMIVCNNQGRVLSAIECFRLKNDPRKGNERHSIGLHVRKIFRNEPLGVSPLLIIVYCETRGFGETWVKYLDYLRCLGFGNYPLLDLEEKEEFAKQVNIRVAMATHHREQFPVRVYHLMINMYP